MSRRGGKGGGAAALYIAESSGALGPLFAPSFVERRPIERLLPGKKKKEKHGWIFESPELSFEVRRRLLQKPSGAGAGSHQLPDPKKL